MAFVKGDLGKPTIIICSAPIRVLTRDGWFKTIMLFGLRNNEGMGDNDTELRRGLQSKHKTEKVELRAGKEAPIEIAKQAHYKIFIILKQEENKRSSALTEVFAVD